MTAQGERFTTRPRLIRHRAAAEDARLPLLPRDLLERAATRIGNAALVYGLVVVVAVAASEYNFHALGRIPWDGWNRGFTVAAVLVVVSAAMFAASRARGIAPERVLRAGLIFEVVGAFGIALVTVADTVWPIPFRNVGIPWTCAWILFFPFVLPARPRSAAIAAYSSALTGPAGLVAWDLLSGLPLPSLQVFAWLAIPPLICAGVATFGSEIVHGLGVRLGREQALGSYWLEEKIGKGGQGHVWRASHRALASPAAVKFVHPNPDAAKTALDNFYQEAHATARLTSPHTVRVYHYGVHDDGAVYFVMEFLDGMDLNALVEAHGPVPPERAAHFLIQACGSLGEAHAAGLVHRDIKPANLFVCRQGLDHDFLKVLDFGLVRRDPDVGRVDHPAGESDPTITTNLVGTPITVAPERVNGRPATSSSDLYSLGCVGYWLLTHRPVFETTGRIEMILAHVRETPIRPSDRIGQPLHDGLEELIMRCLEKDPERRPHGAGALCDALRTLRFPEPWTQERAAAWWEEHRGTRAI